MSFSILFMLMTLMGSGTDLLDYVPSDDYWKAKGVTAVTPQALLKELEPPKAGGEISKLVPDLSSPDFKVRDAAGAKVRAMGPGVIPQLRELARSDNPEAAGRARQLIAEIGNAAKAAQVRQLMAIRTLGEKKAREALPKLNELARSAEPFVADYARAAAAAIEGKPYTRRHEPAGDDAWLLPEECRAVVHVAMRGGKPVDFDAALKAMPMLGPHGDAPPGGGPRPPGTAEMRKQIVDHVIKIADRTGNARIDGITLGLSGDIGNRSGFVAVIAHGEFDAKAVSALVGEMMSGANQGPGPAGGADAAGAPNAARPQAKVVDGVEVHDGDRGQFAVLFPTNRHAVFIGGPREAEKPVQKLIAATKTGNGGLKGAAEMVNLIKTIDTRQPVWGAVQVTDVYRQAAVFSPFDTVTLQGKLKAGQEARPDADLDFRVRAAGKDAQQVKDAVAMVNAGVAQARQHMKQSEEALAQGAEGPGAAMLPLVKQVGKVLDSVQCTADGQAATLTATVNGGMLLNPMLIFGGVGLRAEAKVQDGAAAVEEVRPPPPPPPVGPRP